MNFYKLYAIKISDDLYQIKYLFLHFIIDLTNN